MSIPYLEVWAYFVSDLLVAASSNGVSFLNHRNPCLSLEYTVYFRHIPHWVKSGSKCVIHNIHSRRVVRDNILSDRVSNVSVDGGNYFYCSLFHGFSLHPRPVISFITRHQAPTGAVNNL